MFSSLSGGVWVNVFKVGLVNDAVRTKHAEA